MTRPLDILLVLMDPRGDHPGAMDLAWREDVDDFWEGICMATSLDFNFGITSAPKLVNDGQRGSLTFAEFREVILSIRDGLVPGDRIPDLLVATAQRADAEEWNLWYRRILMRTLHKFIPMATIQRELIRLTTE